MFVIFHLPMILDNFVKDAYKNLFLHKLYKLNLIQLNFWILKIIYKQKRNINQSIYDKIIYVSFKNL